VCEKYKIIDYTINDDLSIDVDGGVYLNRRYLEYLPLRFNYVNDYFNCSYNKLKTLEGCPQVVGGTFNCYFNKLKTLEGCPQTISGSFNCSDNYLKLLKGCPQTVDGSFDCSYNKLISLEDGPQTVGGYFECDNNKLTDMEHFPEVNGPIIIDGNPVNSLIFTFIKNADSFLIEDFVDYEIVRNGDTVMLDRLRTLINDNDLKMPDLEGIKKHYKIIE
jgi:hypothetical protein